MDQTQYGSAIRHSFTVAVATDNTPIPTILGPFIGVSSMESRHREGVSLPGYRELIQKGQNATTRFSAYERRTIFQRGTYNLKYGFPPNIGLRNSYWRTVIGQGGFYDTWPSLDDSVPSVSSATDALALSRFYAAFRECQSQFQGMIFLGELRETIGMLKSPVRSLRKLISEYFTVLERRLAGVPRGRSPVIYRSKLRKVASDTWLEYSFGMVPLVSDIRSAVIALKRIGEQNYRKRISGTCREKTSNTSASIVNISGGYAQCLLSVTTLTERSVRYIGVFDPELVPPRNQIQSLLGFRLEDIAPAAWELTPWSFLLDYFVNIGQLIDAYSTCTAGVVWTAKTIRTEKSVLQIASADSTTAVANISYSGYKPNQISFTGTPEVKGYVRKTVLRDKFDLTPPPLIIKMHYSTNQWINMAALSQQSRALRSRFSVLG